jgi:hypothetical protein
VSALDFDIRFVKSALFVLVNLLVLHYEKRYLIYGRVTLTCNVSHASLIPALCTSCKQITGNISDERSNFRLHA